MSTSAPPSVTKWIRTPGYLILGLSFLLPFIELLAGTLPIRPGAVTWRFAFEGVLSSAVGAQMFVLFLLFVLALFCGDRKMLIAIAIVSLLLGVVLLISAGSFTLDSLQMKRRVPPTGLTRFNTGVTMGIIKLIAFGLAAFILALVANKSKAAKMSQQAMETKRNPSSSLIMGQGGSPRRSTTAGAHAPAAAQEPASEAPIDPVHDADSGTAG